MAQLAHGMGDMKGARQGEARRGGEVRGKRRLTGELQACTQDVQRCVREVSQGAVKGTAGFRLFAKCGVLALLNLHRKERYALHLTWRHLPNSVGFAGLRSASRCNWKTSMPVTGDHSDCVGYDRSKAAERNWGGWGG